MKKIFVMTLLFVFGMSVSTFAQSKEYQKQQAQYGKTAEKMAKKKAKELKKEKWQTSGATALETMLANYYMQTEEACGGDKRGMEHTVTDAKTISMAEKRLLLQAQSAYAQEMESVLGATITEQDSATGTDELQTYIANVAAKVKGEFNGDVKRSFLLYRQNPDGKSFTVRAFFVIDENSGRLRAKRIAQTVKDNNELSKEIENAAFGK